ncbi:LysM peptidoglycan-binding domain-containing protein [Zhihengliuella halotolerans]|nr:LysM peptidoglycan-binding domain-containing protein [Zhihengliuella halotolerans]
MDMQASKSCSSSNFDRDAELRIRGFTRQRMRDGNHCTRKKGKTLAHISLAPDPSFASTAQLSAPRTRPGKLRLTQRGRFVLIGLPLMLGAALLVLLVGLLNSPANAAGSLEVAAPEVEAVTVLSGDSLWGLAQEFAPARDPRIVISEIVELNGLEKQVVEVGQEVFVPVG